MPDIDRRGFLTAGAALAATLSLPLLKGLPSPMMAEALRDIDQAIQAFETARAAKVRDWARYEAALLLDGDGFWDWYMQRDTTQRYYAAWKQAQEVVEDTLMIPAKNPDDEDALMTVLDVYAQISGSSFATQTARDLFTPPRYQTFPHDRIRHWLLTDPDEDFEKTGMPAFLRRMRDDRLHHL